MRKRARLVVFLLSLRLMVRSIAAVQWRRAAVVLAAGVLVAPAFPARAATDSNRARMDELRAAIGEASTEEAAALAELGEIRARRQELDAKVRAFDSQIGEARLRADAARAERDRAEAESRVLGEEITKTEADMAEAKDAFDNATAAMYRGSGSASTGPALLFELNPEEIGTAQRYLSDTSNRHLEDARQYIRLKDKLERQRSELDEQREAAVELAEEAEREEQRLASLRADQDEARQALQAEEGREAAALAAITARKDQFAAELAQLEADSQRIEEQLRSGSGGAAPGQLLRPVSAPITSPFGPRVHPILGTVRIHTGIDFGAGYGTPIKAAGSGTVVTAGVMGGYGNVVVVDHGGGLATLYAHQSSLAVGYGAGVSAGEVVGYVGSSGQSTGPHLHWEVRDHGTPVDPMNYL